MSYAKLVKKIKATTDSGGYAVLPVGSSVAHVRLAGGVYTFRARLVAAAPFAWFSYSTEIDLPAYTDKGIEQRKRVKP